MRIQVIDREEAANTKTEYEKAINIIKEKYNTGEYEFSIYVDFDCYSYDIVHYISKEGQTADSVCELLKLFDTHDRIYQYSILRKNITEGRRDDIKITIIPCDMYVELFIKLKDISKAPMSPLGFPIIIPYSFHKHFQILADDSTKLKEWCDNNLDHMIIKTKETEE